MHVLSTLIPSLGLFAHLSAAAYTLQDDYGNTETFFDKFSFFTVCSVEKIDSGGQYVKLHARVRTQPTAM